MDLWFEPGVNIVPPTWYLSPSANLEILNPGLRSPFLCIRSVSG